jgi:aminodeoxyfutalosine synthase
MNEITAKVAEGVRLTEEDALYLYKHADLLELGELADRANRAKNGDRVFFNVNRHINPTNICQRCWS